MNRYVSTRELIRSLFDWADGNKSVGQCVDDTPTAEVIEIKAVEDAFEKIKLKAWKDGHVKLDDIAQIFREVIGT